MTNAYRAFLETKVKRAPANGFAIAPAELSDGLKDFNKLVVAWALAGGCRAIFAKFGLHKTRMQLEIMRQIGRRCGGRQLIVAPLGVRTEFFRDALALGLSLTFIRRTEEAVPDGCYLTNYESVRDGKVDPNAFLAASLDEASVLRSFGSKTYQTFLTLFAQVRFRFVATATPSPNRFKELIHYAGFLGVMDTGQALTRFFQRNSEKAGDLQLYPHKVDEFWLWVASWAVMLQRPSDLGFSDEGYDLPPLVVRWHEVPSALPTTVRRDGQGVLLRAGAVGLADEAKERRATLPARIARVAAIVAAAPADHFILWHDLEAEREALETALPGSRSVYGTQEIEEREARIVAFSDGGFRLLNAKPVMCGSGCNFQRHSHRAVFVGIGHKFNDFIQAIHRQQRFGQPHPVEIDIVLSESDRDVRRDLEAKWAQHEEMAQRMSEIIRHYGLNAEAMALVLQRSIGVERIVAEGEGGRWRMVRNDTVEETARMATDTVDLVVTSIPFANHYEYTPSYNDFGHTEDNAQFFAQMDHLTPEILRVLKPGRMACIHVKDRILFGAVTGEGVPTVDPFHAECIFHYRRHGFQFLGLHHVNTDVVRENNQTYRLGYTEMRKDATKMGCGCPEYVLLLRKPQSDRSRGYADVPVTKEKADYSLARWQIDAHAHWRSSGERLMAPDELASLPQPARDRLFTRQTLTHIYDFDYHLKVGEMLEASGKMPTTFMALVPAGDGDATWHDVQRMRTLNTSQAQGGREKHVCLARGSLVLTRDRGYVPIQDVTTADHVLTHRGRWRGVEVVANTGVRPVVTLRAQGVPGLTLTPDHRLWTRPVRLKPWSRSHSRREASSLTGPSWIPAEDTVGSYVNLRLPPTEPEGPSIIDQSFWWVVGRWIADGHVGSRGDFHLSCGDHEVDALMLRLGAYAGRNARLTPTAWQIRLRDPKGKLRSVLDRCGRGAANKVLPPEAFVLPYVQASALLEGYLSGDGHFRADRQRWSASSVSKALLLGVAMLVQRTFGAVASLYAGRAGGQDVIDGRTVTALPDWVLSFDIPDEGRPKGLPFILDDGAWKKVREAVPAGEVETWCLRVEEDESFTAEGCVVKNCPLQFDIVDRLIQRYSMPGERVFDPFGGIGTVPLRALKLGRDGWGNELNEAYWRDACAYLTAEQQRLSMPTLFDAIDAVVAV